MTTTMNLFDNLVNVDLFNKLLIKYQNKRKSKAAHSPSDDIAAA